MEFIITYILEVNVYGNFKHITNNDISTEAQEGQILKFKFSYDSTTQTLGCLDVNGDFYSSLINAGIANTLDINSLNGFN